MNLNAELRRLGVDEEAAAFLRRMGYAVVQLPESNEHVAEAAVQAIARLRKITRGPINDTAAAVATMSTNHSFSSGHDSGLEGIAESVSMQA